MPRDVSLLPPRPLTTRPLLMWTIDQPAPARVPALSTMHTPCDIKMLGLPLAVPKMPSWSFHLVFLDSEGSPVTASSLTPSILIDALFRHAPAEPWAAGLLEKTTLHGMHGVYRRHMGAYVWWWEREHEDSTGGIELAALGYVSRGR